MIEKKKNNETLLKTAILGSLISVRFAVGSTVDLTRASLHFTEDFSAHFSGVRNSPQIADTFLNNTQKIASKTMDWLQKVVKPKENTR